MLSIQQVETLEFWISTNLKHYEALSQTLYVQNPGAKYIAVFQRRSFKGVFFGSLTPYKARLEFIYIACLLQFISGLLRNCGTNILPNIGDCICVVTTQHSSFHFREGSHTFNGGIVHRFRTQKTFVRMIL